MKKIGLILLMLLLATSSAWAGFVNGDFETGDFSGWTTGSGLWRYDLYDAYTLPNPTDYLPGGSRYDGGVVFAQKSAIVTPGPDPVVGNLLNQVYGGNYSARVNNWDWDSHVSVISQTVPNYTDSHIYFAWAAVLEESHGPTDSDNFSLKLTDDTQGDTLYSVAYSSATTPGYFNSTYYNWSTWYYTDWQVQDLDVTARQGHTFTLTLLGSDCPWTGHGGYVYLDGFGAAPPQPGVIPEPCTLLLFGTGIAGAAGILRKRIKKN